MEQKKQEFLKEIVLIATAALSWCITLILIGDKMSDNTAMSILVKLSYELIKAILIAGTVNVAFYFYIRNSQGETPKSFLEKRGIKNIYSSRKEAISEFERLAKDSKKIYIAGISLRDFLTLTGELSVIWNTLCKRLDEEEKQKIDDSQRLTIRLLLLNPLSSEGRFRHQIEAGVIKRTGFETDVRQGIEEIQARIKEIYTNPEQKSYLEFKLYEHCPFAFMFITETNALVEQYYYRKTRASQQMNLIKYYNTGDNSRYNEIFKSFELVWNGTNIKEMIPHGIGVANAIESSKIINIFRRNERAKLTEREIFCINGTKKGDYIDIMAITGKFYMTERVFGELLIKASKTQEDEAGGVNVRFAILNPLSQQAIYRAVAESSDPNNIRQELRNWNWEKHTSSKLYKEVNNSIHTVQIYQNRNYSLELQLYSCAPTCALIKTSTSVFVEHYLYGRNQKFQTGLVLGKEYPVFEYEVSDSIEVGILSSSFNVIWDSFSIGLSEYEKLKNNEIELFEKNLTIIRCEMGLLD